MRELLVYTTLYSRPAMVGNIAEDSSVSTATRYLHTLNMGIRFSKEAYSIAPTGASSRYPLLSYRRDNSALEFVLPMTSTLYRGTSFANENELPHEPVNSLISTVRSNKIDFAGRSLPLRVDNGLETNRCLLPNGISDRCISKLLVTLSVARNRDRVVLADSLRSASCMGVAVSALTRFNTQMVHARQNCGVYNGTRLASPGEYMTSKS